MGERSNKNLSFLKAAALALALAIGANGAIFSLEGLNRSGGIYTNPVRLLFESDLQSLSDDSSESDAAQSNLASENARGCNALLLGCYQVALNAYPVGASIFQAIAGKAR